MAFKRVLKWVVAIILALCLVLIAGFVYISSRIVPPVSGQAVDAITGKPIEGIEVALHVTKHEGFGIAPLRYESKVSNQEGRFRFAFSYYWDPGPIGYFGEYW